MGLPDIQSESDERAIDIDEVGISGLRYPVTFDDGITVQQGIAEFSLTVRLAADRRGTHMSRMVQLVDQHLQTVDPNTLPAVLKRGAEVLEAKELSIRMSLPFATAVSAPVSKEVSWQVHQLQLLGIHSPAGVKIVTSVTAEVTSLCPCSRAISEYGAHNQRSRVCLEVTGLGDQSYPLDAASMVEFIREIGSCPVYPVVKRPDERAITMTAFDRPMFVEDMVRDLSESCRRRGLSHRIEVRNLESIHSHDAIARLEYSDPGQCHP